jgi:hypothetical protein
LLLRHERQPQAVDCCADHGFHVVASQEPPPRRFIAGADAIGTAQQKIADLQADINFNGSFEETNYRTKGLTLDTGSWPYHNPAS